MKSFGVMYLKYFMSSDGVGRKFLGTVQSVWWCNNQHFYARIKYDDGDAEGITVEELEELLIKINSGNKICRDSECDGSALRVVKEKAAAEEFFLHPNHVKIMEAVPVSLSVETVHCYEVPPLLFETSNAAESSINIFKYLPVCMVQMFLF